LTPTPGARSIGAGLEAARPARAIRAGERIHVVGVAGAGASAAALLARWHGAEVSGCDRGGASPYTPALEAEGIGLAWEHAVSHVRGANAPDRLAVTKALTAVDPDNPELAAARAAGVPLEAWQQVVADAAFGRSLVAVAGTHGKSTSAGWLVHVLVAAGLDPSAFVGALLPRELTGGLPATARRGQGRHVVVEADEYAGNFDPYRPDLAILTSAEWDHPDVFPDTAAVVACFLEWLERAGEEAGGSDRPGKRPVSGRGRRPELAGGTAAGPVLVANIADPGVVSVLEGLRDWPGSVVATLLAAAGESLPDAVETADLRERFTTAAGPAAIVTGRIASSDPGGTLLEIRGSGPAPDTILARLQLAGRHNSANALGVAAAAATLGIPAPAAGPALASFRGVGRRLQRLGEGSGVVVYDDYGHHPTAIRETLAAVRQLEPGHRIWAVYEPLTYHRTAAMLSQFAEVLATADAVAVADIWASRDPDTSITSASALAEAVARWRPGMIAAAPGSVEATAAWLAREVSAGDVVLVMGGGRSYRIAEELVRLLGA
jgi:UDP-N-acetylmuramate--alanine ligase